MTGTLERKNRIRVPILKLRVDLCDYEAAIDQIDRLARERNGGYVCVANVHGAIEAEDDSQFAELVNNADLVLPDGRPFVWMQMLQGNKNASQVRGPALMPLLMRHAAKENLNVGFLGGRPEVLAHVIARAADDFPELNVTYKFSPPFGEESEEARAAIEDEINDADVQILFVGLGCPKQERWIAAHRDSVRAVTIGVGAAFDLYAGKIREAPSWISKLGLEWVFRLLQEPRRLFSRYLLVNPRFVFLAGRQLLLQKVRRPLRRLILLTIDEQYGDVVVEYARQFPRLFADNL